MFAWIAGNGCAPGVEHKVLDVLDQFGQADRRGVWVGASLCAAQTLLETTVESEMEQIPYVCPKSGRVVTAWVRLDNRHELYSLVGDASLGLSQTTDPMLLAAAYDRWGDDCPRHLVGSFSFVIYDPNTASLFACRDPLGTRPLYYHLGSSTVVISTTASVFHVVEDIDLTPSLEWLALFVTSYSCDDAATPWLNTHKLEGGHSLKVPLPHGSIRQAQPSPQRYFEFDDDPSFVTKQDDSWVDAYRSQLDEAVRCRLRTNGPIAIETTGGLDSSACLGIAASLWPGEKSEIHTIGSMNWEFEPDYMWATSELHGLQQNHHIPLWWPSLQEQGEIVRRRQAVLGYPEDHTSGSFFDPFYCRTREVGAKALISGFGGDEGVSNDGNLLLIELARHARLAALLQQVGGPWYKRPVRATRALRQATSPRPGYMQQFAEQTWEVMAVRPELVAEFDLVERYLDSHRFGAGYDTVNGAILGDLISGPMLPARLECGSLMAQARSVEYR